LPRMRSQGELGSVDFERVRENTSKTQIWIQNGSRVHMGG